MSQRPWLRPCQPEVQAQHQRMGGFPLNVGEPWYHGSWVRIDSLTRVIGNIRKSWAPHRYSLALSVAKDSSDDGEAFAGSRPFYSILSCIARNHTTSVIMTLILTHDLTGNTHTRADSSKTTKTEITTPGTPPDILLHHLQDILLHHLQ